MNEDQEIRDRVKSLLEQYLESVESNKPVFKSVYDKKFEEYSNIRSVVTIIIKRIDQGFNPHMVIQDMMIQSDYFSQIAYRSGNMVAYEMFSTYSDVSFDILDLLYNNDIKEDLY